MVEATIGKSLDKGPSKNSNRAHLAGSEEIMQTLAINDLESWLKFFKDIWKLNDPKYQNLIYKCLIESFDLDSNSVVFLLDNCEPSSVLYLDILSNSIDKWIISISDAENYISTVINTDYEASLYWSLYKLYLSIDSLWSDYSKDLISKILELISSWDVPVRNIVLFYQLEYKRENSPELLDGIKYIILNWFNKLLDLASEDKNAKISLLRSYQAVPADSDLEDHMAKLLSEHNIVTSENAQFYNFLWTDKLKKIFSS